VGCTSGGSGSQKDTWRFAIGIRSERRKVRTRKAIVCQTQQALLVPAPKEKKKTGDERGGEVEKEMVEKRRKRIAAEKASVSRFQGDHGFPRILEWKGKTNWI
jgi:hypothetical protein